MHCKQCMMLVSSNIGMEWNKITHVGWLHVDNLEIWASIKVSIKTILILWICHIWPIEWNGVPFQNLSKQSMERLRFQTPGKDGRLRELTAGIWTLHWFGSFCQLLISSFVFDKVNRHNCKYWDGNAIYIQPHTLIAFECVAVLLPSVMVFHNIKKLCRDNAILRGWVAQRSGLVSS